jgi:hypothetical protein
VAYNSYYFRWLSALFLRRRLTIALLCCHCILLSACGAPRTEESASAILPNSLSLGIAGSPAIAVPTRWADDLNYKTRAEIIALRKRYVAEVPALCGAAYEPSEPVFGNIEDHKPWWGLAGRSVWGAGQRSIEGLSEESRFLSNPYLLVGCDPASANIWKKDAITKSDLDDPDFPYAWHLKSLSFWPDKKVAQAVYLVSDFNHQMFVFKDKLTTQTIVPAFNLACYNARDFGYNWIWLDEENSSNIENVNHPPKEPVRIIQMFHCGGTCGFAGGCNNMSPMIPAIDRIKYSRLPAKAAVRLWKEKPSSVDQAPDVSFYVILE